MVRSGVYKYSYYYHYSSVYAKKSRIVRGGLLLNLKLINSKHLVYFTSCSMDLCRGWGPEVNKIQI